ncbi:MAG TPA: hypothetical protein PLO53_03355, partial [Candidatus Hydrogenedentes bacterium]|nr:hypothetical protein [Candidatus Hydrogenedentota bacterium]
RQPLQGSIAMAENYEWHFNEMRRCDKERNPIQGEFFTAEAIDQPGKALIREGIQNALDARQGDGKVTVRVYCSGERAAVNRSKIKEFFRGLEEHLNAPGNGLQKIPGPSEPCPYLVLEDWGTTGLTGDPEAYSAHPGTSNHFYHFFRAEGRSDKGDKNLGRWGVGKHVFLVASRINTLFGLTVRGDDGRKLLMGMSVLKTHEIGGRRYFPDGWFGHPPQESDGLVRPIEDSSFISQFEQTFNVSRDSAPGLSIVVPWCGLDLTAEDLVRAVLNDYFWPILQGRLDVRIETPGKTVYLEAKTLKSELRKIGGPLEQEIMPLCELSEWANQLSEERYIRLRMPADWQWTADMFPPQSIETLREKLDRGEKIAFRIPVRVAKTQAQDSGTESFFDVLLYRDGSNQTGKPVFIREGIIIPEVRQRGASSLRGIRSLVIAEDAPIAAMLGDAENPSHTEWQRDGTNFKGKYVDGPKILEFIRKSVHEIVRILNEQDVQRDPNLLADVFFLPQSEEEKATQRKLTPAGTGTKPEPDDFPSINPTSRVLSIEPVSGGFMVYGAWREGHPLPKMIKITVAYDVRNGNPFLKYSTEDFDLRLNSIKKIKRGALLVVAEPNTLIFQIDDGVESFH